MKNAIFTLLALIFIFFNNGVAMAAKAKADILIESLERVTPAPEVALLPGDGIAISAAHQLQGYLPDAQKHDFYNSHTAEIGLYLGEYIAELIGDDPLKSIIDKSSYYALFITYNAAKQRDIDSKIRSSQLACGFTVYERCPSFTGPGEYQCYY